MYVDNTKIPALEMSKVPFRVKLGSICPHAMLPPEVITLAQLRK